jgi:uncharacterized membrane protein YkoI
MSIAMSLYRPLLLALTATSLIATPAMAAPSLAAKAFAMAGFDDQRPRDQDRAFRNKREGRSMPLPMLERRVRPQMGGADYLGPELKGETYRLKYMQDGRVIWVDVDAATGRILRRSGN